MTVVAALFHFLYSDSGSAGRDLLDIQKAMLFQLNLLIFS